MWAAPRRFNGGERLAMVIVYLFFGFSKLHLYEQRNLVGLVSHGPLIFWLEPVFGMRGTGYVLGISEWLICLLLFLGFWDKRAGILGALGICASMISTSTIIPFLPNGWEASAGGFPAMTDATAFLLKDIALLAVGFYLLKQDLLRVSRAQSASGARP
jgi:uncharacterized membrane protein YkgB